MTDKQIQARVEISESSKEFHTTDISLAAVLVATGRKVKNIASKLRKNKFSSFEQTVFIFDSEGTRELLVNYMNNELSVDARTLLDCLKNLKSTGYSRGAR